MSTYENKEHYLRCKNKTEKSYALRHMQLYMSKKEDLQSIMSNYSQTVV